MGNVPPCVQNLTAIAPKPFELTWLYACDRWISPHLLVPYWITVYSRSLTLGLLSACIWEFVEIFAQSTFGNFVFFAGANDSLENYGLILEDFLMGLFGSLLGVTFNWVYWDAPVLLTFDDLYPSRFRRYGGRFFFYVILGLLSIAGGALMALDAGSFPLGPFLWPVIFFFFQGIVVLEQYRGSVWPYKRLWPSWSAYWTTGLLFTLVVSVQHIFNYLYSSAVQTWVWSAAYFVLLLLLGVRRRVSKKSVARSSVRSRAGPPRLCIHVNRKK